MKRHITEPQMRISQDSVIWAAIAPTPSGMVMEFQPYGFIGRQILKDGACVSCLEEILGPACAPWRASKTPANRSRPQHLSRFFTK